LVDGNLWESCVLLIVSVETPTMVGVSRIATFVKKDKKHVTKENWGSLISININHQNQSKNE